MENVIGCCVCIWCLGLVLFIILFPLSVHRLQYDEIGLVKNRFTGEVNREEPYDNGFHVLGVTKKFIRYPSNIQTLSLHDVSAWTLSSDTNEIDNGGTNINVDVTFQYYLIFEELGELHEKVGNDYIPLLTKTAVSSIKNDAPNLNADQYLYDRRRIELSFLSKMRQELLNMHVNVTTLQLREIEFPERFYTRKMQTSTQLLRNQKEEFIQESKLIEGETERLVKMINNDANVVLNESESRGKAIVEIAKNEAKTTVDNAKNRGLLRLRRLLNITSPLDLIKFDYLIELENSDMDYLININPIDVLKVN